MSSPSRGGPRGCRSSTGSDRGSSKPATPPGISSRSRAIRATRVRRFAGTTSDASGCARKLDAAYFHLYGLHEDDVAHVMDSFELARKRDQRAHGVYRTKAAILDIYRRMAKAAATGEPYEAAIDPAPADPRAAHPARSAEEVAGVAATLHRALVERDVADARDESSARARGRRRSSDRSSASGDRGSDAAPPSGPDRTAPPGGD